MMGGSAAVPGSNELLTLLQVLADPAATKATIKALVEATEKATTALQELIVAQKNYVQDLGQRDKDSEHRRKSAEEAEAKLEAKRVEATLAMDTLDKDYLEEGKKLHERKLTLDQLEANFKTQEFEKTSALELRERAVEQVAADVRVTKAEAEADASAAMKARALYEGKLHDLNNQLQKLAR